MKWITVLALFFSTSGFASYMNHDQIKKQFGEPGHIPQGLKMSRYHPLSEVIHASFQQKLKSHKGKLKIMSNNLKLSQSVDMRKWDSSIREQWDGTCTAHGLMASVENLLNRQKTKSFLSTRYFWNLYQEYSAEVAVNTVLKEGLIDDMFWPQDNKKPVVSDPKSYVKYKVTSAKYLEDDTNEALQSLDAGFPVYLAFSVPQDLASCRSTIRYSTGVTTGGHAESIVGYRLDDNIQGGGYFILKNSWGTECGDGGYQYLPIGLCNRADMYCLFWSIEKASII